MFVKKSSTNIFISIKDEKITILLYFKTQGNRVEENEKKY